MLKIKKTIYTPSNKTKDQINQMQNEIKYSIKIYPQKAKTKPK